MTKMQIWSKETPRRPLRKKPKKKAGLLEASRQLLLHPYLFLSLVLFLPFCFLLSSSLFSFLTTTYTYLPFLFSLSSFDYGTILVLVLADPALARPGHLPPLDLNPIYLSTAETLRIFAWLAHSNFLADAWTPRRPFWALSLIDPGNLRGFRKCFLRTPLSARKRVYFRDFLEFDRADKKKRIN